MSYLKSISRLSITDNIGGLLTLYVARKAEVLDIPDPSFCVIAGNVTFLAGAGFVQWDATMETLRVTTGDKTGREGSAKSNRIPFVVPKDRADLRALFTLAEDDEFIVLQRDSNGTLKLFGLLEAPVKFRFTHDSGSRVSDGNFYNCEFYFDGPDNINFYNGAITMASASTGTSRVQFTSGELISLLSPSDVLIVTSGFEHTFTKVPGFSGAATPAIVKWDTGEIIDTLQPGDTLLVDTAFTFDFEIIGNL